jgi:hypothetical protein
MAMRAGRRWLLASGLLLFLSSLRVVTADVISCTTTALGDGPHTTSTTSAGVLSCSQITIVVSGNNPTIIVPLSTDFTFDKVRFSVASGTSLSFIGTGTGGTLKFTNSVATVRSLL